MSLDALSSMQKKLYHKIQEIRGEADENNEKMSADDIVEELMGNPKYKKDYGRQSPTLLRAMVNKLTALLNPERVDEMAKAQEEDEKKPNLFNKSLPFLKNAKKHKLRVGEGEESKLDEEVNGDIEGIIIKKIKKEHAPEKKIYFSDIGGIEEIINEIKELIIYPMKFSHLFHTLGVKSPKGILLCGPPGSGKTSLGIAICTEMGRPFKKITGTEIISGMSGESESKIRTIFEEIKSQAPSILFIDEIDTIASRKDHVAKEMERRVLSQLLSCLDDVSDYEVFVIGATSRPESLDTGLRRSGRFDREITLSIPNEDARHQILAAKTRETKLDSVDLKEIAKAIPGYVGADIEALVKECGISAVKRLLDTYGEEKLSEFSEEIKSNCLLNTSDFQVAMKKVQPTAKREGFSVIPGTTWEDIGALQNLREELETSICWPIKDPERFLTYKISPPAGVLLYGPPGCGKTLLAKAVANESKANFISIKGPELLNKYVGESERAIRELFRRAKSSAPCVIFFDEIDAITPKRGSEQNQVTERVVNQLLTELDGMEDRKNVFVIAATNRPDIIDSAMLRPGRLDKLLYVPIPTEEDRISILKAQVRKSPVADNVNVEEIAKDPRCEGYTGADLSSLVKEAAMCSMKRMDSSGKITQEDFYHAFSKTAPSISTKDKHVYEDLQKNLRKSKHLLGEK